MHFKKPSIIVAVSILFILVSFFTSLSLVPTLTVFYFDQSRDAYEAYTIWHDFNLKIMGPSSDIPGINHGVLWYYFLAAIYAIGKGIPENAVMIMMIGLYAMMPTLWYFTRRLTNSTPVTAVSVALYAMAPLFCMFTLWLSNPTLALFISPPLIYFIWSYIKKPTALLALWIGLFYGLLIQSDFGFLVLLFVLPIYYFAFHCKFSWKHTLFFAAGLFVGLLTFFISYVKFKTNVFLILGQFLQQSSGKDFSAGAVVIGLIDAIVRLFSYTYLPLPALITFFVLVGGIAIFCKKRITAPGDDLFKFLAIWLLSGFFILSIFNRGIFHTFFITPFLFPLAIMFTLILTRLIKDARLFIATFVILGCLQFLLVHSWARSTDTPLSIQTGMTTKYERDILNYVYQSAGKEQFVISTITNPLFINTTWAYWFNMYGKPTYGYLPYFWGRDQAGHLGSLPMQTNIASIKQRYLIIEPANGIPKRWITKSIYEEDLISDVIEEKKFGHFTVQKRILNLDKDFVATPAAILEVEGSSGD
jgi:hypothetical protein